MTATLGFLSVKHHPEHGYFGGYLLVNRVARPLEFHCTMPVKPSRAQQLLYGPTIDDFVCGEQIAKALTAKAKLKPQLVLTDSASVLAMSLVSDIPIAQLIFDDDCSEAHHLRNPDSASSSDRTYNVGKHVLTLPHDSKTTEQDLHTLFDGLADSFDPTEPFQRVVEALLEAHPLAKAA